jgi:hypothetical protein
MATCRILFGPEIPAPVRGEDELTPERPPAFQARTDRAAVERGPAAGDALLRELAGDARKA